MHEVLYNQFNAFLLSLIYYFIFSICWVFVCSSSKLSYRNEKYTCYSAMDWNQLSKINFCLFARRVAINLLSVKNDTYFDTNINKIYDQRIHNIFYQIIVLTQNFSAIRKFAQNFDAVFIAFSNVLLKEKYAFIWHL